MIALTVILIICTFLLLINGNKIIKKNNEFKALSEKNKEGIITDDEKEVLIKGVGKLSLLAVGMTIYLTLLFVYFIKALNVDPYLYPTVAFLSLLIFDFIRAFVTKRKNQEKITFIGYVKNLLRIGYFIYMFIVLVF